MDDETARTETDRTELREAAIAALKKRRGFYGHLMFYVMVNIFLVVIWWMTSSGSFFWPIFPMVGWGIAVVMNAWDVFFAERIDEETIEREMRHMQHH